jgi:very-short-patch-repair endonuclease
MKKGKLANHYINGITLKKHRCLDCNKKISCYSKRCFECAIKELWQRRKRKDWHPKNYKGGFSYCISCGKQTHSWVAKRCVSCASKIKATNSWKKPLFRKQMTKTLLNNQQKIIKTLHLFPNKPEKILISILPKSFEYVGNGKIMIDRFNPDFIDIKNKKIIELFGDYWHNLTVYKERDKRRLKMYRKQEYKTLIIWEHELENINKVLLKINRFRKRL